MSHAPNPTTGRTDNNPRITGHLIENAPVDAPSYFVMDSPEYENVHGLKDEPKIVKVTNISVDEDDTVQLRVRQIVDEFHGISAPERKIVSITLDDLRENTIGRVQEGYVPARQKKLLDVDE